jgi:hypothetical protein
MSQVYPGGPYNGNIHARIKLLEAIGMDHDEAMAVAYEMTPTRECLSPVAGAAA